MKKKQEKTKKKAEYFLDKMKKKIALKNKFNKKNNKI